MGGNIEDYNDKAGHGSADIQPVEQTYDTGSYDNDKNIDGPHVDAVFGAQGEGHTNYTSMSWQKACFVLLKSQVALGVLSMPTILLLVGGVPGTIIIFAMGLITSWSDWQVGRFKRNHPECYGIDDAGYVLAGRWGKEFFGALYAIFLIALIGASLIPISIALNVLSDHAICTVGWVSISAIVCFALGSIQTLNKVSWVTTVGFVSIMAGIITISVAVGVQERPAAAPPAPAPWDKGISSYVKADFLSVVSAMITAIFGLAGTPMFFPVISEMKKPRDFNKSLAVCQSIVVSTYITIAVVVWYYCGIYLSNPALGSAGYKMKKVSYGVALIGLFSSGILYTHYSAKIVFMRLLRNSEHLTKKTKTHYVTWYGTVAGCVILGWLLAEAIPFFGGLVLLLGSLCGTILALQGPAWMWLHDNWKFRHGHSAHLRAPFFWPFAVLAWVLIVFGSLMTVAGVVAAIKSIISSFQTGGLATPFGCADNS